MKLKINKSINHERTSTLSISDNMCACPCACLRAPQVVSFIPPSGVIKLLMISLGTNGHFHRCLSMSRNLMNAACRDGCVWYVCVSKPLWILLEQWGFVHAYALTQAPMFSLKLSVNQPSQCSAIITLLWWSHSLHQLLRTRQPLFIRKVLMTNCRSLRLF